MKAKSRQAVHQSLNGFWARQQAREAERKAFQERYRLAHLPVRKVVRRPLDPRRDLFRERTAPTHMEIRRMG